MHSESWSINDIFNAVDIDCKGWISIFDLEKLIVQSKKNFTVSDLELLVQYWSRSGQSKSI